MKKLIYIIGIVAMIIVITACPKPESRKPKPCDPVYIYDTIIIHDTVVVDRIVHDTVYINKIIYDTIVIYDTIYIDRIIHDTIYLPCDTIQVEVGDYYVSPNGNDNNSGLSLQEAFATIEKAASMADPGDVVLVADGIYTGSVRTSSNGTSTNRIKYKSINKWKAKMVGDGQYTWTNRGDYVDIEGFDITTSVDFGRVGIFNYGAYTRILSNRVHDLPSANSGTLGGAGIDAWGETAHDTEIRENTVYNIGQLSPIPSSVHGIYIASQRGVVSNNIVYKCTGWGVHVWHKYVGGTEIINNTLFGNGGGVLIGGKDVVADYFQVINNIVYDNGIVGEPNYGIKEHGTIGTHNIYSNNLVFNNLPAEYRFRTGTAINSISVDPQFIDYKVDGSGNYNLRITSPAIDAGIDVGLPYNGVAPDMGAIEK